MADRSPARHPWSRAAALGAATSLLVAGCASSPPPTRYYSLLPPPGPGAPAPPTAISPGWSALTVAIPAQVDRPQWVVRRPDDSLAVLDDERWAAPLADEIGAAVSERLLRAAPATMLPAGHRPWRIAIDVQRFESAPQRWARIEADWSLRPDAGGDGWRCHAAFERPAADSAQSLAEAHRAAVAALGDAVARGLAAALAGAGAPVCGAG
jgi:uncharacterized lipoprotein YmbA